jgi:uracil-DNA glycosylase
MMLTARAERASELELIRAQADGCTNCDLYREATQTVFGQGSVGAPIMLVGEQPGDKEDRAGLPFVGPAGQLLERALRDAGVPDGATYATNAVKHFKFERSGKVRVHKKPNASQVRACRPWLEREIELVDPRIVMLLGSTAAQAMLGTKFRVTQHRGELVDWDYTPLLTTTIHPAAVLRAGDRRKDMYAGLVHDLAFARQALI